MKSIVLKKMIIQNFKGIENLQMSFGKDNTILGDNGTGKTTIFDAFSWALFGKNSEGKTKFNIQTLDKEGNIIHGIECNVTLILEINGCEKKISRTLKENWVRTRGKDELKNTPTVYEIDDVPMKEKDYKAEINKIIDEELFKMVTNPFYFTSLNWKDQRNILLEIIGDIDNENVIAYNKSLSPLQDKIKNNIDDYITKIKASINKLKEKVKSLPYRIDECHNSLVEVDKESLESKKKNIHEEIEKIDLQLQDSSKANEAKLKLQEEIFNLKNKKTELISQASNKKAVKEVEDKIFDMKHSVKINSMNKESVECKIKKIHVEIEETTKEISLSLAEQEKLREEWFKTNDEQFIFDETQGVCPCCGRAYEEGKIQEIKESAQERFSITKEKKLEDINKKGVDFGARIVAKKDSLNHYEVMERELRNELDDLVSKIKSDSLQIDKLIKQKEDLSTETVVPGLVELEDEIAALQLKLDNFKLDNKLELKSKKETLLLELEGVQKKFAFIETNKQLLTRIEELKNEEKDLNIKIGLLTKELELGEEFVRTKVELLEESINKKFKGVTFKLFNTFKHGGIEDCCEALVQGVPFRDANTAGKINAGLSIINTLSQHYDVSAPVFIDNRESINKLTDFDGQLVNLKVTKDKKLKISEACCSSKEEEEYLEEKLQEIREKIGPYSNGYIVEDLFSEAEKVDTQIGEPGRWSYNKTCIYKYKNMFFAVSWEEPSTELQDGQETSLEIYRVNPIEKMVTTFE